MTTETQASPLKYEDLLAQSKDQKDESTRQLQVEEAKLDLDSQIHVQKKSILSAERALQEKKSRFPLDIDGIMDAQTELRDLTRGMEDLEDLKAELF